MKVIKFKENRGRKSKYNIDLEVGEEIAFEVNSRFGYISNIRYCVKRFHPDWNFSTKHTEQDGLIYCVLKRLA